MAGGLVTAACRERWLAAPCAPAAQHAPPVCHLNAPPLPRLSCQVLLLVDGREQYARQGAQARGAALEGHLAKVSARGGCSLEGSRQNRGGKAGKTPACTAGAGCAAPHPTHLPACLPARRCARRGWRWSSARCPSGTRCGWRAAGGGRWGAQVAAVLCWSRWGARPLVASQPPCAAQPRPCPPSSALLFSPPPKAVPRPGVRLRSRAGAQVGARPVVLHQAEPLRAAEGARQERLAGWLGGRGAAPLSSPAPRAAVPLAPRLHPSALRSLASPSRKLKPPPSPPCVLRSTTCAAAGWGA